MASALFGIIAVGSAATKAHSFYKTGKAVYDYLWKLHVKDIKITVAFERQVEKYIVMFEAVKDSHIVQGFT
ncbi:hypothetical protein I4U23_011957 [Adineta vaga]|nr:hypothetical protein I4U23_011957 [Adineta vaga]